MFYAKPCCVFKNVLPGYAINSVVPESAPPTPQHWFHRANCILIRYLLPYTYWRRVSIQDVFCAWHFKKHAGRGGAPWPIFIFSTSNQGPPRYCITRHPNLTERIGPKLAHIPTHVCRGRWGPVIQYVDAGVSKTIRFCV